VIKDHGPKNPPPRCNLGGHYPSPSGNFWKKNQLSVLSIYIVVIAVADCGILREFFNSFDQNTDGKYIRWFWNSLNISLRILFGCAVAYFFIRIPDFLKNYAAICFCLLENLRRCHQNCSNTQVKFFKDLITSRISWLQNFYDILQGFRAEF